MAEIICFDGRLKRYQAKGARPQVTGNAANKPYQGNQWTRRSMIQMFLCGGSIRAVGRRMGGEATVEQELREALLDRGIAA